MIISHRRVGPTHLVCEQLSTGAVAAVFFSEVGSSLAPVEVRFYSMFSKEDQDELGRYLDAAATRIAQKPRVTSHLIRELSLSDLRSKLRSMGLTEAEVTNLPREDLFHAAKQMTPQPLGYRNTRDLETAVDRLRAATLYAMFVADGERKPMASIAEELNVSIDRARALVSGARRDGLLTSDSAGAVGGTLTNEAKDLSERLGITKGDS